MGGLDFLTAGQQTFTFQVPPTVRLIYVVVHCTTPHSCQFPRTASPLCKLATEAFTLSATTDNFTAELLLSPHPLPLLHGDAGKETKVGRGQLLNQF